MEASITPRNAVDELMRRVPAFAKARSLDSSFMSYGDDGNPYLVFGDLGLFLLRRLKARVENPEEDSLFQQSFKLINEMLTSSDPEVANLAQLGVMETLSDSTQEIAIAKAYLSEPAKKEYEKWMRIAKTTLPRETRAKNKIESTSRSGGGDLKP